MSFYSRLKFPSPEYLQTNKDLVEYILKLQEEVKKRDSDRKNLRKWREEREDRND